MDLKILVTTEPANTKLFDQCLSLFKTHLIRRHQGKGHAGRQHNELPFLELSELDTIISHHL